MKIEDSACRRKKFGYCKLKDEINFVKNKHQKNCKMFQIDISCRFGRSCTYLHIDNSRQGNKHITNEIKVDIENIENVTKKRNIPAKTDKQTGLNIFNYLF